MPYDSVQITSFDLGPAGPFGQSNAGGAGVRYRLCTTRGEQVWLS
jgi:hypothetical protein